MTLMRAILRFSLPGIFLVVSASAALAGEDWTQFRGPAGDGHAASHKLPVEWSESTNVAWKTAIHGKAWSSPVAWKDRIWMTSATEDGKQLSVVCVDAATGKILHDRVVFDV